jgi:SAM-dependent methyltransferase
MLKKLIDGFFKKARCPHGIGRNLVLLSMNFAHRGLSKWGLSFLAIKDGDNILDIGCGGGAAIALMAGKGAKAYGVDHSGVSVEKSLAKNRDAVRNGRVEIQVADALRLPFSGETFTLVTAFETIYFWENIQECFRRIQRLLRPGGRFAIALEGWKGGNGEVNCPKVFVDNLPMNLYSEGELRELLLAAGFDSASSLKGMPRKWLCVVASKEGLTTPEKPAGKDGNVAFPK